MLVGGLARRRRRLRRRRGRRSADAGDRLRDGAAGDVRRAGAAGGAAAGARRRSRCSCCSAGIFAVVGAPFVARGVRAIVRSRAAARVRRRRGVARRERTRGCSAGICCRRRAASSRSRSRCSCRRSSSPKRRCRTSASAFPIRSRAGARCCTTRRTSGRCRRFSVAAQSGGGDVPVRARAEPGAAERPAPASRIGGRCNAGLAELRGSYNRSLMKLCRRPRSHSHPVRRARTRSIPRRLRAALTALAGDAARPASSILGSNGEAALLDDVESDRVIATARDAGADGPRVHRRHRPRVDARRRSARPGARRRSAPTPCWCARPGSSRRR